MAKLSEEAKKIISELRLAQVATASKGGKPNVSPKGSLRVVDDEHVAFSASHSPRTVANLRENPQLSAIFFDPATRKGCRVWGRGEVLEKGDLFDTVSAEYAVRKMELTTLVRVTVEQVETF